MYPHLQHWTEAGTVAVAADQGQWQSSRVDKAEVAAEQQRQSSRADRAEVAAEQQRQQSSRVERSH